MSSTVVPLTVYHCTKWVQWTSEYTQFEQLLPELAGSNPLVVGKHNALAWVVVWHLKQVSKGYRWHVQLEGQRIQSLIAFQRQRRDHQRHPGQSCNWGIPSSGNRWWPIYPYSFSGVVRQVTCGVTSVAFWVSTLLTLLRKTRFPVATR